MFTITFITALLCVLAIGLLAATFGGYNPSIKYASGFLQFAIGVWWIASHFGMITSDRDPL